MRRHIMDSNSSDSRKYYTFSVSVSFNIQFTFTENDIQPAEDGGKDDIDPSDEALARLEQEIEEYLSKEFTGVRDVEAFADFDSLLGVVDSEFTDL